MLLYIVALFLLSYPNQWVAFYLPPSLKNIPNLINHNAIKLSNSLYSMVGHDLNVSISGFNIVSREKDTNFEILDAAENTISLIDIKSGWGISI